MTSATIFRNKLRTIGMALFLTGAISATAYATTVNSALTTLTEVRVTGNGVLVMKVPTGDNGCGGYYVQVTDAARAQDLRPLALAAFLAGKQVTFTNGTCSQTPWANNLVASDMLIK
jgi:hypothetical protein